MMNRYRVFSDVKREEMMKLTKKLAFLARVDEEQLSNSVNSVLFQTLQRVVSHVSLSETCFCCAGVETYSIQFFRLQQTTIVWCMLC